MFTRKEKNTLALAKYSCFKCGGEGRIEIFGDGEHFEYDVVGYKQCPDCQYD